MSKSQKIHTKSHLYVDNPATHQHSGRPKPKARLPTDIIDLMDDSVPPGLLRHHSGPFDPVTQSAYLPPNKSPLAALQHSTEEALKATPESAIRDSLLKHVPLQNTAVVGPGEHVPGGAADEFLSDYQEENLLGDVGRWQGIEYDDDDRRAKGHPGWDGAFVNRGHNKAERSKKEAHKPSRGKRELGEYVGDYRGENDGMIEMVTPERDIRVNGMQASASAIDDAEREMTEHRHGIVSGIKRRISLVRKHHRDHSAQADRH